MRLSTVDAVRDGIIECTISINARGTPISGQYVIIHAGNDLILGRLGQVNTTNAVHDDPAFKPFIMKHGSVNQWSGDVDVETSVVEMLDIINDKNEKIARRSNPQTGTDIMSAEQDVIRRFYNEQYHMAVIGTTPNSGGIEATISNKDFGPMDKGGYGEARHFAIFGQNGSGKTAFLLEKICLQLSAHPSMGLLMPDTAGDLSNPTKHTNPQFQFNYEQLLRSAGTGIRIEIIEISDVRLTSPYAMKELLAPILHSSSLSMHPDNAAKLASLVVDSMFDHEVQAAQITVATVIDLIVSNIGHCYAKGSRKDKEDDAVRLRDDPGLRARFESNLRRLRAFFDGRHTLRDLIEGVLQRGRKVCIRMDASRLMERQQEYVMRELMDQLQYQAAEMYRQDISCNALVVLDEGARWAPEGSKDSEIGGIIARAYRETRKCGLGWGVSSQRMAGISKDILAEARTVYFGRGLGVGADSVHLEARLGKEGLQAYKDLSRQGGFFFVGLGMDANLGTEGNYFCIHPFSGDATRQLIETNPHIYTKGSI